MGSIDSSVDRVGFIIAQGKDADEAETICEKAIKSIVIEIGQIGE